MQVGCGVYELEIRRHRYLYFWHYEMKGGGRRQVKDYVGSAGSPESAAKAARLCEAYYARVDRDLHGLRAETLASLAVRGR